MTYKTLKTSGKRENSACASMGHLPKLENIKNGGWRRVEKMICGWCMPRDLILVVKSTLPPLFTKLPLLGVELRK